MYNLKDEI